MFSKSAGKSGNPGNFTTKPLHKVTELCPYPPSLSIAQTNVQHELSPQSSAA